MTRHIFAAMMLFGASQTLAQIDEDNCYFQI